jgi:heme exporter protein B
MSSSSPVAALPHRPVAAVPRRVSWAEQARMIFAKDVAIELRTGEVVTTSAFFGFVVVIMSSISFYDSDLAKAQIAAGAIWLPTAFASVLSLSRTWQRERQEHAFDGLLVSPLSHSAIFMGKALGMFVFLLAVEAVVVPTAAVLFSIDLGVVQAPGRPAMHHGLLLLAIAISATPGIAAAGALFGVMTVRTAARDLVLAIVLFPLLSPTLLAAVAATRDLFDGQPFEVLFGYFKVMWIFDVAFLAGGLTLFGPLADGG